MWHVVLSCEITYLRIRIVVMGYWGILNSSSPIPFVFYLLSPISFSPCLYPSLLYFPLLSLSSSSTPSLSPPLALHTMLLRTVHRWNSSLVIKRVFFECFDCFMPLFYIAFYQLDVVTLRAEIASLFMSKLPVLVSCLKYKAHIRKRVYKY